MHKEESFILLCSLLVRVHLEHCINFEHQALQDISTTGVHPQEGAEVMEPCHMADNQNSGNIQIDKEKTQKGPVAITKYLKHCHMRNGLDLYWVAPEVRLRPINEKGRGLSFQHRKSFLCLILTIKGLPQEVPCSVQEVSGQRPFDHVARIFLVELWLLDRVGWNR